MLFRSPPHVGVRYAVQGKWFDNRKANEVVIPIIAFIEGGMTIPMGTLTRNYLRYFRLSPTQCAPNMFRVLGSIEALNEREPKPHIPRYKLYLQPTTPKGAGILFKIQAIRGEVDPVPSRVSNKGLKEDFLIFSG